jgi:ABC-type multidrug transport system ATPase subunit
MHTRYKQLSLCAVYTELPEELTLHELYHFHTSFKPLRNNLTAEAFAQYCGIAHTHDLQQIKLFSSGMKQRIKLGLAFLEQTELLLLDEPCSNLDKNGISWYRQELIAAKEMGRTIVIASNQEYEYPIADEVIDLERYKV